MDFKVISYLSICINYFMDAPFSCFISLPAGRGGNYTFNIMTLSGLLLLIGVVVDDAIVVLENVHRHLEAGETDQVKAAVAGTGEVVFAVMAASLTLVCIFATVIFMEGMVGVFMRSFAVVVTVGVLASLLVSLTLTPALCARFLKPGTAQTNGLTGWIKRGHDSLESGYRSLLSFGLRHRLIVLVITALLVGSTAWFMGQLGSEFFPEDDESRFMLKMRAPLGSSIDYMEERVARVEQILGEVPEVVHVLSTVGSDQANEVNEATLNISLVGKQQRQRSQTEIMAAVRQRSRQVTGVQIFVSTYPLIGAGVKRR